jgi:2-C-methyl-D-erythritol 2,4-cyclodiphosphate synthase
MRNMKNRCAAVWTFWSPTRFVITGLKAPAQVLWRPPPPFYRFTVLPIYRFTVLPIYRFTVLPIYRFTVPQFYRYNAGMNHVGIGYDVHQLVEEKKLVLGGVVIPHGKGLDGHSDADVLMHAICDAVLGALGESDIGHFFPNTDPRWRDASSKTFLQEAGRQVKFREGMIVNVDATLIAQEPKVAPFIQQMKRNIAEALGINAARIGIKATTNEHLGFIGRQEGIAAMAVTSIELPHSHE